MREKDTFSGYHPLVNFLYFGLVLAFTMVFMHPACLGISLFCAFAYSICQKGKKAALFGLKYMLPMFLVAAVMNPAFNHEGETILRYFKSGNPLTLESVVYGMAAAAMLVSVITWFSCYSAVMTSDKFIFLFGRVIPAMSLILSMTLRFVPMFKAQIKTVCSAQRCLGRGVSGCRVTERVKNGTLILSVMVTWALENAVETADSMKSRGYGLKGRTAYSVYRFDRRDAAALIILLLCGAYVAAGALFGAVRWRYFPTLKGAFAGVYSLSVFASYFALCILPVVIKAREDWKWKSLRSAT